MRTTIRTVILQNEKRQLVNSEALTSKKMKLAVLIHYFLLKQPPFQKIIEQATERNDYYAIAGSCRRQSGYQ